jgi:hypothetical protein
MFFGCHRAVVLAPAISSDLAPDRRAVLAGALGNHADGLGFFDPGPDLFAFGQAKRAVTAPAFVCHKATLLAQALAERG